MVRSVVITGGAGFIGSNLVHRLARERPGWRLVTLDALTYAGNVRNLAGLPDGVDHTLIHGDIADPVAWDRVLAHLGGPPDAIVNSAAETHVDRSIHGPDAFIDTNIGGTVRLLELLRAHPSIRLLQVSTDEVYGALGDDDPAFTPQHPLDPSSPYSASKAAADQLALAWHRTYGLDVLISRCSNNYGPRQFPEKLIPLMILRAREGGELPVYGTGRNVRDWIHVDDHCAGLIAALEHGEAGAIYHFGGRAERANLDLVHAIADRVAGHRDGIRFVQDRPGHDWRYAMDITETEQTLGWRPTVAFDEGLGHTIDWYLSHEGWWRPILSGEYREWVETLYDGRPDASDVDGGAP